MAGMSGMSVTMTSAASTASSTAASSMDMDMDMGACKISVSTLTKLIAHVIWYIDCYNHCHCSDPVEMGNYENFTSQLYNADWERDILIPILLTTLIPTYTNNSSDAMELVYNRRL